MSHYFAIVILPTTDKPNDATARQLLDALMNPHREDSEGDGWWDWFRIGGRWDGKVAGRQGYEECGCQGSEGNWDCHYSKSHEGLERNLVRVSALGELRPYRWVFPDGSTMDTRGSWPEDSLEIGTPAWHAECDRLEAEATKAMNAKAAEVLPALRDHWAIGVDYHS